MIPRQHNHRGIGGLVRLDAVKKRHQVLVVPPVLRRSIPQRETFPERLDLHLHINLRIDVRRVYGNMPEPRPDRVDVDTSLKQNTLEVYQRRSPPCKNIMLALTA